MACVTVAYGDAPARSGGKKSSSGFGVFARVAVLATVGLAAGGWMLTALGTLGTVVPAVTSAAPAMRGVPGAVPQGLALVDRERMVSQRMRQSFIRAYTADAAYSNLDWRRSKTDGDMLIVADIGPDSVIEPVDTASLVELRSDRVRRAEPEVTVARAPVKDEAPVLAYAPTPTVPAAVLALSRIQPLSKAEENDADDDAEAMILPDDVPLPGAKPPLRGSRMRAKTQLAYAPESGLTDEPQPQFSTGAGNPFLQRAARNRTAIYDISAATVYLPSGERLEAHSGMGHMRDNPTYANQKNRGPTPPHTYNLRMREALFHGVEAIRLTPVDGNNRYNRDGLLAHTFMLRRRGDSNGCVVFRDYSRFLRAFKRGEFNKMVVVARMSSSSSDRIASLF